MCEFTGSVCEWLHLDVNLQGVCEWLHFDVNLQGLCVRVFWCLRTERYADHHGTEGIPRVSGGGIPGHRGQTLRHVGGKGKSGSWIINH